MIIVSIDESHVRADGFARRKWRFAPSRVSVDELLRPPSLMEQLIEREDVPSYTLPSLNNDDDNQDGSTNRR